MTTDDQENGKNIAKTEAAPAADSPHSQAAGAHQICEAQLVEAGASKAISLPDIAIAQFSEHVTQSAANYFDGTANLALASKTVQLKKMADKLASGGLEMATEDALAAQIADLLNLTAAVANSGAEADSAASALEKIDKSLEKY